MSITDPNTYMSNTFLRPTDNTGEFISNYAKTNNAEDFAESYYAYVTAGNIFRERAKLNNYLNQKYEFLKKYIFEGREYNTGSISSYLKWSETNQQLPWSTFAYMYEDPDWTWDYKYSFLVLASPTPTPKPRRTPTPTPIPNLPPTITTDALPVGLLRRPYQTTITATDPDVSDTLTATITGLPPKLKVSDCKQSTTTVGNLICTISGTPTKLGTFPIAITVTDSANNKAKATLNLSIHIR